MKKIVFEKNQQYQLDAIQSVIDIFEGQDLNNSDFEFSLSDDRAGSLKLTERGTANNLTISEEQLLENIKKVQEANELEQSEALEKLYYNDPPIDNSPITEDSIWTDYPNISIEMETGTGKTYVYLRTIYELNKTYGFKKFIIVVPSVPIREGTVKNLEITHDHLQELYDNVPVNFDVYDSKKTNAKLTKISNFARSNSIEIMVINISSFATDTNIINQIRERGIKPIEDLQGTKPIVILDEPQNMKTDTRKKAITNLNPLLVIRYSATHVNSYNLIYQLDPVKAYDLGLVKQIEVDSVIAQNDGSGAFVSLDSFKLAKKSTKAKITILKNEKNGVTKKSVTAGTGSDLFQLSNGVEAYRDGYVINFIDSDEELIEISSGNTLYKGQPQGGMTDEIQKDMIRATIENHLKKERELSQKGIKVLSIFFIDKVANYRSYDPSGNEVAGKFALWFKELFEKAIQNPKYKDLYPYETKDLHDGYFSQDKNKRFKDSREGKSTIADNETYQLIMKDKEKLLDINTPLRFIFSHSALREGWDNPNVFQICTLNETQSTLKKRQEIGRGLRLCVTQEGVRNRERAVNRLTIVANESYEVFARSLQNEIQEECGVSFKGRIKNARDRTKVELKKGWELDQNFLDLWNRIKHKTEYNVDYDTAELIEKAVEGIKNMEHIPKPSIQRIKNEVTFVKDDGGNLVEVGGYVKSSKDRSVDTSNFDIPDFIAYIQSKTELTRDTISKIVLQSGRIGEVFNNPQLFMDAVVKAIKIEFDRLKISGIKYERIADQFYEMQLFESTEIESYVENLIAVKNQDKTLYNYVLIDSLSTPERKFAEECETRDDVLFYIKLPSWFTIKTPIGGYNPDWALIKPIVRAILD
ncbi:DEAD/DEAH box helicase family protein [Bernardetia sp.]|uniref:restriction endonuclease n=1 Tax=Bernardetia sp. TaxID=1937974 RepID=UPI0025C06D7B|nr:DEAD/DEAH box helicase family protein [Bernardetia sp.]